MLFSCEWTDSDHAMVKIGMRHVLDRATACTETCYGTAQIGLRDVLIRATAWPKSAYRSGRLAIDGFGGTADLPSRTDPTNMGVC